MIAPLSVVLVIVMHVCALVYKGPFGAVMTLWIWTMGMFAVASLINRVGRPQAGDQMSTVTGDNNTDFALAAIWPIGFVVVTGYWLVNKINLRVRFLGRKP